MKKMLYTIVLLFLGLNIHVQSFAEDCVFYSDTNYGFSGSVFSLENRRRVVVRPRLAFLGSVEVIESENCTAIVKHRSSGVNLFATTINNPDISRDFTPSRSSLIYTCQCNRNTPVDVSNISVEELNTVPQDNRPLEEEEEQDEQDREDGEDEQDE